MSDKEGSIVMESNVRTLGCNLGLSFCALGNFFHRQKHPRVAPRVFLVVGAARVFLAVKKLFAGIKRGLVNSLGTKLLFPVSGVRDPPPLSLYPLVYSI